MREELPRRERTSVRGAEGQEHVEGTRDLVARRHHGSEKSGRIEGRQGNRAVEELRCSVTTDALQRWQRISPLQ